MSRARAGRRAAGRDARGRRARGARAALPAALGALLLAACAAPCPPDWLASPPRDADWIHATGSVGALGLEIDPERVALSRAARRVADALGLDVELQLSVLRLPEGLVVEAYGRDGPTRALDGLELVESARCDGRVHVLVRLPRPER